MSADEEGTLARIKAHRRDLIDAKIAEHRGRIIKTTGDGLLVEFASAVDAVRCGTEVQSGMRVANAQTPSEARIELRIGINLGDIIVDGDDLFGDGVNIAARLESLAEPGDVWISASVEEQVRGKIDMALAFDDMGEHHLKNIARPVRIYRVRPSSLVARPALTLPDKPSIAVLPFQNMSGDPDQDYFADGVVEDVITALSHMRWLFVIARNSSFTYKGRAVDVKQVGRELGVRYVLEGSVRRAASRVRVTGQLVDATTGAHLWADRFDGALEDIFDLQDRITASVVGAIAPKLEQAEIERARRKPTESLDAYDYYLRGLACIHQDTPESSAEALRLFSRAIALDPEFATAYGLAVWCHNRRKASGWTADRAAEKAETARLARRAAELGRDDAVALGFGGVGLFYVVNDFDGGGAMIDRALTLDPNLASAWMHSGWLKAFLGESDQAIERLARAMRLSPLDPLMYNMCGGTALAHFVAGRYDEAASWAEQALHERQDYVSALRWLAASRALAGRLDEAGAAMARLRLLDPRLSISDLAYRNPFRRPDDLARLADGLRKAGLPE